jgi:hypothetical protein
MKYMGRQKRTRQQDDQENDNDYIAAAEVARVHNVSIHTIRRRIRGGGIFKGAKKVPNVSDGEIWVIPRSEVESVSLKEISPKLYQKRYANKLQPYGKDRHNTVPTSSLGELEDRVSVLERRMVRLLGR